MTRFWKTANMALLDEAAQIVKDRGQFYGPPGENHERTAAMWSAYLDVPISAVDVCALNILQKMSREANCHKRDNFLDVAGFAANADECV